MAEPAKRAAKKTEAPGTGLAAAVKIAPKLSAPKEARARVEEWLGEIARSASGKAIKQLLAPAKSRDSKLGELLASIAEASPYLWDLIRADPDRFLGILEANPDTHFAALIADVAARGKCRE